MDDIMIKKSYDPETKKAVLYWRPFTILLDLNTQKANYYRDTNPTDLDSPDFIVDFDTQKMRMAKIALGLKVEDPPLPRVEKSSDSCPEKKMSHYKNVGTSQIEYIRMFKDSFDKNPCLIDGIYLNLASNGEAFIVRVGRQFYKENFIPINYEEFEEAFNIAKKKIGLLKEIKEHD